MQEVKEEDDDEQYGEEGWPWGEHQEGEEEYIDEAVDEDLHVWTLWFSVLAIGCVHGNNIHKCSLRRKRCHAKMTMSNWWQSVLLGLSWLCWYAHDLGCVSMPTYMSLRLQNHLLHQHPRRCHTPSTSLLCRLRFQSLLPFLQPPLGPPPARVTLENEPNEADDECHVEWHNGKKALWWQCFCKPEFLLTIVFACVVVSPCRKFTTQREA